MYILSLSLSLSSRDDGSLNNNYGLSRVVQFNPIHDEENFLYYDSIFRRVCALGGLIETQYRSVRPPMGCDAYRPPRRGKYTVKWEISTVRSDLQWAVMHTDHPDVVRKYTTVYFRWVKFLLSGLESVFSWSYFRCMP